MITTKKNKHTRKKLEKMTTTVSEPALFAEDRRLGPSKAKSGIRERDVMPIVIENLTPSIEQGLFNAKSIVRQPVEVGADIFKNGHDVLKAAIKYRGVRDSTWKVAPMKKGENDHWSGVFVPNENKQYFYSVQAWVDPVATWVQFVIKKCSANTNIATDLEEGIRFLGMMQKDARGVDIKNIELLCQLLRLSEGASDEVTRIIKSENFVRIIAKYELKKNVSQYHTPLKLVVDRKQAEYSAWYEMFPRSQAKRKGKHGTFRDCIRRLPDIKKMGFDVIYLPPIHPIGRAHRKGPNNSLTPAPDSPGSPWAIGAKDGGHKAIHAELGTMKDFTAFVNTAHAYGMEIALDLAYQCSPDHPYVKKHPEWFYRQADGTIRYAENPPKKYQDIYPIDFDCDDYENLWQELKSVVLFWIQNGVRIFRVDNPHTKPLRFWQWLIAGIQYEYPDVLFLAEAFTRPKVMKYLAKAGFTQSYTYFTWRNKKWELKEYLQELTQTEMRHYFRGNFFANTPDILHEFLQHGGRPAFKLRLVLAATLSSVYGIYSGYEFCENIPVRAGSEEYLDSEKYEIRNRDWDQDGNIKSFISRVNRIRRENPALHMYGNLEFYDSCNENILCFGKRTHDNSNMIVVVVNLNPFHTQEDMITLPLWKFGVEDWQTYRMKDLITGDKYYWKGQHNYVRLDPQLESAHIFKLEK